MNGKHSIENRQVAQLRTRLADQLAQFHPQLLKTLLRNLSELVAALPLFRPLAESLLAGFVGRSVRLILDPTDLAADLKIVRITLACRGRVLPLA